MFLVLQELANGFNGLAQAHIVLILHFWDLVSSHSGHGGGSEDIGGGDQSVNNRSILYPSKQ